MIIDFNIKLQEKKEAEQRAEDIARFKEMYSFANDAEKAAIREAVKTKNEALYKETIWPVINRMVMVEMTRELEALSK